MQCVCEHTCTHMLEAVHIHMRVYTGHTEQERPKEKRMLFLLYNTGKILFMRLNRGANGNCLIYYVT